MAGLDRAAKRRRRQSGPKLVVTALSRSFVKRRVRALAAVLAGIATVALTAAVLVVSFSVSDAIGGSRLKVLTDADWAVVARSSSGVDKAALERVRGAASGAVVAPTLVAQTRTASDEDPLVVVGADQELLAVTPKNVRAELDRLPPLTGTSVYLTKSWAKDHGVKQGEEIALESPTGASRWRVAGLVGADLGNEGAVALAAMPAVARAFDRGDSADVVFVDGKGAKGALRTELQRAAEGAASVVPPAEITRSYEGSFGAIRDLLNMLSLIIILAAAAVVFAAWRLTVEEERPNVARLRLLGVTRRDIITAAAMLAAPFIAISLLIGFPLGLLLGSALSGLTRQLIELTQLAAEPGLPIGRPLLGAFLNIQLVVGMATIIAFIPLMRMTVVEGLTGRTVTRPATSPVRLAAIAVALLGLAALALAVLPEKTRWLALVPLLAAVPVLSRVVPRAAGHAIRRSPGWLRMIVGRSLAQDARRGATFVAFLAFALALAFALEGIARSLGDGIDDSVAAWTRGDVFVQTAESGSNLTDDKFGAGTQDVLAGVPGVTSTAAFTYSTLDLHGQRTPLWTWDTGKPGEELERFVDLDVTDGPRGAALWDALDGDGVAVSSNYAYLHDVDVGDQVTVPTQNGSRTLPVRALFDDLASDGGVLVVGPEVYREITGDEREYQLIAELEPGTSQAAVQDALRSRLGERHANLVVWDRQEIREHFTDLNSRLLQTFHTFARVLLVLALLLGATVIAAAIAARRRAFALERLVGVAPRLLRRQIVGEYVSLGLCAWIIAVPVGLLLTPALLRALALGTGMVPPLDLPWGFAAVALPATALIAYLALAMAGGLRQQSTSISRVIADE